MLITSLISWRHVQCRKRIKSTSNCSCLLRISALFSWRMNLSDRTFSQATPKHSWVRRFKEKIGFLETRDKSWFHSYQPESKWSSVQSWRAMQPSNIFLVFVMHNTVIISFWNPRFFVDFKKTDSAHFLDYGFRTRNYLFITLRDMSSGPCVVFRILSTWRVAWRKSLFEKIRFSTGIRAWNLKQVRAWMATEC